MHRRGRKPQPQAHDLRNTALDALPRCPTHLTAVARKEWRRLATPLFDMGILTLADRAALAAYCQSYARWVEAEDHLARTPALLKSPSGYVQQSPWLTVANKQLELMGRFMSELGLSPSSRTRLSLPDTAVSGNVTTIEFVTVYTDEDGKTVREPMGKPNDGALPKDGPKTITYELDGDL